MIYKKRHRLVQIRVFFKKTKHTLLKSIRVYFNTPKELIKEESFRFNKNVFKKTLVDHV